VLTLNATGCSTSDCCASAAASAASAAAAPADANWALNGLKSSKHESVTMDAFEFLERAAAGTLGRKLFSHRLLWSTCGVLLTGLTHLLVHAAESQQSENY
jgi:hypothetical protein